MRTFEAYNARGVLLRTFSHRDLAVAYREKHEALLGPITIKIAYAQRRRIAA